jgi:hypothetical protein
MLQLIMGTRFADLTDEQRTEAGILANLVALCVVCFISELCYPG